MLVHSEKGEKIPSNGLDWHSVQEVASSFRRSPLQMTVSVFLSHNKEDKAFVRQLARDLDNHGVRFWLDEAEINVGDSLIEKIRSGLDEVDYVAVILSPNSIASPWVQREVDVAMNQEISGRKIKVLPIMYHNCELPGFLLGKAYADFTEESLYEDAFAKLVRSIGIVFNKKALESYLSGATLGQALDNAAIINLPMFRKPFHRPFQYMGMSVSSASESVGQEPNAVGNIIVENDDCSMLLEAEGNFIHYVEVDLKKTEPHLQTQEFDSVPILGSLSINPSELELVRKQTHFHAYYDHRKKLKISVCCSYDGAPL
jgi:TIR domain